MMKIKTYKNVYGHEVAKCPFCEYVGYVRDVTNVSPDPLRDLKRHITNQAKNEAFEWHVNGVMTAFLGNHLVYYKEHTAEKPVVAKIIKRQYDNDFEIIRPELTS